MELELRRVAETETCTHGKLYIDGVYECVTLEDIQRTQKVYGETAIPCGRFPLVITPSPRFKRDLPLIMGVPDFSGIRIHTGNSSEDTEGCILVGMVCPDPKKDWISSSRIAFNALYRKLELALLGGEAININVRNMV